MLVVARRVEASSKEVRYKFGMCDRFDRILTIHLGTLEARVDDAHFDSAAGAITSKIVNAWRRTGQFPARAIFAS
ncbi:hypothetical protein ACTMSW_12805 [Micromonospora sp. BQ11]|uniref:hypothetical protein n=1 Tax=Micromonospora sp. BQ11 TaxID=3452212 RepID=UPI003F88B22A